MQKDDFYMLGFIQRYEAGETDDEETLDGFQHLVDSGAAWTLQGSYGRMAASLIDAGLIQRPGNV